jgi:hypothetical protein
MTLVESLPKINVNEQDVIYRFPAGESGDGVYVEGYTSPTWFTTVFPAIANSELPLPREQYDAMKAIDKYWLMCAAQWRKDGVFEVVDLAADVLLDDEETLLAELNPPEEETTPEEATETPEEQTTNEEEVTEEA